MRLWIAENGLGEIFRVKSFLTDEDGLSVQDIIALTSFLAWLGVSGAWAFIALTGAITEAMIDFYASFTLLPLAVVGGVFGVTAVRHRKPRVHRMHPVTEHVNAEYDGWKEAKADDHRDGSTI